jgi:replicative DNA helicase
MSVTDDVRTTGPRPPEGGGGEPRRSEPAAGGGGQFDRTPPQDVAAEQCALGGMLLSKDAIADVVEILKSSDFYKPAHATIFDAIIDIYGRGEPADAITVAAALHDSGDLARIGGAPYVHTLIASVPTAANASYYAKIVSERATLRRLIEAGTRIVQLGFGSAAGQGADTDDLVDMAQQAVYEITERRTSEDFASLAEVLQPTLDEIEAVGASGGMMTGVPTGFSDLDRLLNGLHPGQLIIVAGRPGLGKALALDTPLPTPTGWTTMGAVKVGEQLIDAEGRPTVVTAATEVMYDRACYEVEFSDGSVIVADGSHRWLTHTRETRGCGGQPVVHTTDEILATLRTGTADRRLNHSITNTQALALPERDLLIPAYTLGLWLGDGHSEAASFTTDDPELILYVEDDGFEVRLSGPRVYTITVPDAEPIPQTPQRGADCGAVTEATVNGAKRSGSRHHRLGSLTGLLREAGVLGDKHIPAPYLRAAETQRRALLAGLMDTDGTVTPTGNLQYCSTSRKLAEDVYELVVSLGYRCTMTTRNVSGRTAATSTVYTLNFTTGDEVFRLERKRLIHKERRRSLTTARIGSRFIVDVRPIPSVPVRCVQVDNDDHLYLAGRSMIPTHNSTASMDFARHAAIRAKSAAAIFSLEMSKVEIVMRVLSAEARVPLHVLRSGQLSDDDWTKLARCMGEISDAPFFVDDTPNMNLMEIRAKARRLKQKHDLKLIVVDYLQLMSSPKKTESRQQEVAELSRGLKLLAKEVEAPVIAVSQLNRGPEQRTDKRPQLSDLRESGSIEQDADVVILLHRDDYYDKESPRAGEADFIVAKHRNGPTDTVTVAAQLHLSRFVDMAI